jgi:hypothetical protein
MMGKHEEKLCPRCGALFECRVGDILRCQCAPVPLTAAQADYVRARFEGCLCADCLRTLRAEHAAADVPVVRLHAWMSAHR